jgi:hypothetical protein
MSDQDKPTQARTARALAAVALAELFSTREQEEHAGELKGRLVNVLLSLFRAADKPTRRWLLDLVPVLEGPSRPHPPELVAWLRGQIGRKGLEEWVRRHSGLPAKELVGGGPRKLVAQWLGGLTGAGLAALLAAGARFRIQHETPADRTAIRASFQHFSGKEMKMATSYYFDPRGLPPGLDTVAYENAVQTELKGSFGLDRVGNEERFAAIAGMMLLDEQFASSAFGFRDALQKVWVESLGKTLDYGGTEVPNNEIYKEVAADIVTFPGHTNGKISFQEFAAVVRYAIAAARDVPLGHPNFATQVRLGLDHYVAGAPSSDSLILQPLTGEDGSEVEVSGDRIRAVAMVYAGLQLERMRLFNVVDRITELFMNGMLPIDADSSGRELDAYYYDSEDRPSESARRMLYARVLGAPGADVSKEVQPNREFDSLFLRFLSSLAEYDRQRRIGDLFDANRRALTLTGEQVRKTGRDLGANASLYGWGGTHFAARRLNAHITRALDILKMSPIQSAYGVKSSLQVIERVSVNEFGAAPNIVKYRTMAESGKAILDLLAKHAKAWSASSGRPLFTDEVTRIQGDIPSQDQEDLMRNTQYWLAVNGIGDDQVGKMSQPSDTTYAPSIPAYGGGGAAGTGGDAMEKIKQMVQSGSAPSIDQLKQMFPM